jgi:hypothetical protein
MSTARRMGLSPLVLAAAPALALCVALAAGSLVKAKLLAHLLKAPVNAWRWALLWAGLAGGMVGTAFVALPHRLEWVELVVGLPAILGVYGLVIWRRGFGPDDRALFRRQKTG